MKEFGEIANLETLETIKEDISDEEPLRKRLMIFNHVNANGRIYVAKSKEEIQDLLYKDLYLTSGFNQTNNINDIGTVDISKIIGQFKDIEIIETDDIGIDDLPIFEVYGKLRFFNTPSKEFHKNCFDANIVTIGLRAIGNHTTDKIVNIKQLICWDTIVR